MTTEMLLQTAQTLLAPWTRDTSAPAPERLDVMVAPADLPAAAGALQHARWGYLSAIIGLDLGPEVNEIEVLYSFSNVAAVATLRVRTPRSGASVPTITKQVPAASFYERELMEMLGVTVVDTPNTDHLFLPDNWKEGDYPLRKDFGTTEAAA